jgi:hypothetical protein
MNGLVKGLNLCRNHAELLGSRFQEWNLLEENTMCSVLLKCEKELENFFP